MKYQYMENRVPITIAGKAYPSTLMIINNSQLNKHIPKEGHQHNVELPAQR